MQSVLKSKGNSHAEQAMDAMNKINQMSLESPESKKCQRARSMGMSTILNIQDVGKSSGGAYSRVVSRIGGKGVVEEKL